MGNNLPFREGRYRLSVAHLLTALVALFVVMPIADQLHYGDVVESVAFTLVLLAAVNAIGGRQQTQIAAAVLAVPAFLAHWLNHFWPQSVVIELSLLAAIVFVSFVMAHLFRFVISAPAVNAEVLCAAISIYLLFAVAWAFLYRLLARWDANAFDFTDAAAVRPALDGFTALYFSVQVLTTITFGDILPRSNIVRMMTLVEATAGVFYMAILIARLVGLYSSQPRSGDSSS